MLGTWKLIRVYDITAMGAVRQSKKDKWAPRECVLRYRAFRDEVRLKIKSIPADYYHAVFLLPMPRSWSQKEKRHKAGTPHRSTPDKDNLEKALLDAIYRGRSDAHIWNGTVTKLWAYDGKILISDQHIDFNVLPVNIVDLVNS